MKKMVFSVYEPTLNTNEKNGLIACYMCRHLKKTNLHIPFEFWESVHKYSGYEPKTCF